LLSCWIRCCQSWGCSATPHGRSRRALCGGSGASARLKLVCTTTLLSAFGFPASTCYNSRPPSCSQLNAFEIEITMASTYKPIEAIQLLRPTFRTTRIPPSSRIAQAAFSTTRPTCATHSSTSSNNNSSSPPPIPQRRSVTITNDTGSVRWSDLSPGEKAARTTQQSFNFLVIIAGIVATVRLFLFSE
jgi:hypothetical protein